MRNASPKRRFDSFDPRIHPVYLCHLLFGLCEGVKHDARLDWKGILSLANRIVEHSQSASLPVFESRTNEDDDLQQGWDGVYKELGSLLQAGLEDREHSIPFASRDQVWPVIEFLSEHPDPRPADEVQSEESTLDPFTLSINTVRGIAFHALFGYIFWCNRHLKDQNGSKHIIPTEAKRILEAHVEIDHDPGLTIRSVCGHYFPWLLIYDRDWALTLVGPLFPANDMSRRYAAWEVYLANTVFGDVYTALRPQYEQAISELTRFKREGRRHHPDPIELLAQHMFVAYAYRMDGVMDPLWIRFFKAADPKLRGHAVSFGGRACVQPDREKSQFVFPEAVRLQEFWEWRLESSADVEELRNFGWWVKAGRFDDRWMLERLVQTLQRTGGLIEMSFNLLSELSAVAIQHPGLCGRAVSMIVRSRSVDRLMLAHNEHIESILATLNLATDPEAQSIAEDVVDHLTKLGFEQYRLFTKNPPRQYPEPSVD